MVRLKAFAPNISIARFSFQFLYGAIKSVLDTGIASPTNKFQFLYGAIKRIGAFDTMLIFLRFNSSMVRLKEVTNAICEEYEMFQFLYGAIKSLFRVAASELYVCFNSSMVRLKAVYNGAKKYWLPVVLPR